MTKIRSLRKKQNRIVIKLLMLSQVLQLLQIREQKLQSHKQRRSLRLTLLKERWQWTTMGIIKVVQEILRNTSHGWLSDPCSSAQASSQSMFCFQLRTSGLFYRAKTVKIATERQLTLVNLLLTNCRTRQSHITFTRTI